MREQKYLDTGRGIYNKQEAGIKLHYPLDDWMERLVAKYPSELASIMPDEEVTRSVHQLTMPFAYQTNAA